MSVANIPLQPPLLLLIWTAIWIFRHSHQDPSARGDAVGLLAVELAAVFLGETPSNANRVVLACHGALFAIYWLTQKILRDQEWLDRGASELKPQPKRDEIIPWPWAKPVVIPSRTNHIRLTPKKHAFSYKYLLVGVPVGWTGKCGYWLSCDSPNKALLTVHGADHLQRDHPERTLRQKLDVFLTSQGKNASDYPFAYLVTAPRVLGYSFNPVSFWYLYSPQRRLIAMILEVNNTFDERKPYFLEASTSTDGEGATSDVRPFSTTWAKDFHVSPFNDRQGLYSLRAQEPGLSTSELPQTLANTITLATPAGDPKLVARIFSTQTPLEASSIRFRTSLWLMASYGWVGFVTFPRILREAWKLYFKRALEVWFRPEVNRGTTGRTPTDSERIIEKVFRRYLASHIQQSENPLIVIYKPAPGLDLQQEYIMTPENELVKATENVEIEVLTAAFYSRLSHYDSVYEAIRKEAHCTDRRNRTIYISNPTSLLQDLADVGEYNDSMEEDVHSPYLERWRWNILRSLRCPPAAQSFVEVTNGPSVRCTSQRRPRFSDLDVYAARSEDSWLYRRSVTKLFMAQRYTAGFTGIVSLLDLFVRLIWTLVGIYAVQRPTQHEESVYMLFKNVTTAALLLNAVHGWALLKGVSAPRTHMNAPKSNHNKLADDQRLLVSLNPHD